MPPPLAARRRSRHSHTPHTPHTPHGARARSIKYTRRECETPKDGARMAQSHRSARAGSERREASAAGRTRAKQRKKKTRHRRRATFLGARTRSAAATPPLACPEACGCVTSVRRRCRRRRSPTPPREQGTRDGDANGVVTQRRRRTRRSGGGEGSGGVDGDSGGGGGGGNGGNECGRKLYAADVSGEHVVDRTRNAITTSVVTDCGARRRRDQTALAALSPRCARARARAYRTARGEHRRRALKATKHLSTSNKQQR